MGRTRYTNCAAIDASGDLFMWGIMVIISLEMEIQIAQVIHSILFGMM